MSHKSGKAVQKGKSVCVSRPKKKKKQSPFSFSSDSIIAVTSQEWAAESQSAASQLMLCVQNLFSGIQVELLAEFRSGRLWVDWPVQKVKPSLPSKRWLYVNGPDFLSASLPGTCLILDNGCL